MRTMIPSILLFFCITLCSCHAKKEPPENTIVSMQLIDRNGFSETISTKDRLAKYQETEFLSPQPYQKVLRVYHKDLQGKNSSKITTYHANGHIWQYLDVVDGRAHGSYREWYPNGLLHLELEVIEGMADLSELAQHTWVFDGKNRIWEDSGALIAEISYEKGMLHKPSYYYYPSGKLQKVIPYEQDLINGDILAYDEEGNVIECISYKGGNREGKATRSWSLGQMQYEEFYEGDKLLSAGYFDKEGALLGSIEQGNGYKAEMEETTLKALIEYKKGIEEGQVKVFAKNGTLINLYYQKEGKKQGEEWEYFLSEDRAQLPSPKLALYWHDDMLQGEIKTWYSNGKQESQREMNQNKKHGTSLAWYENGDVMLIEEYDLDRLIKGSYFKKGDKKPTSKIENGKGVATLYNAKGHFLKKIPYEKAAPIIEN